MCHKRKIFTLLQFLFRIKSTYEHMKDYDDVIKSAALVRDGDGRVITKPTNFYTNPPKKGGGNTCPG